MPCVSRCGCCNLKYGYLTYGIISLVVRVCAITTVLFATYILTDLVDAKRSGYNSYFVSLFLAVGVATGWIIASSFALFIALKGIIQKRSILIYPYIVVVIIEIIIGIIGIIIEAIEGETWWPVKMIFWIIVVYSAVCLISLYQQMKQEEKNRAVMLHDDQLKAV